MVSFNFHFVGGNSGTEDLLGTSHAIRTIRQTQRRHAMLRKPLCMPKIDPSQEIALVTH